MDRELVLRARQGDREALAGLIELDQAPLYHYLRGRLGDSDAPDAVQEVVRRVITGLPSLRDPGAYRGWLFGIAIRVVRERTRSLGATRRLAREEFERTKGKAMDEFQRTELHARVHGALEELDEELRTAVLLRYEEGLSYEEIAEATGRPLGTVSKRLHTAHHRLLGILAASGLTIAMGSLTEVLGATTGGALPAEVASSLRRLVLEASPGSPAVSWPVSGTTPFPKAIAIGLPLVLAGLVAILGITRASTPPPSSPSSETARRTPPRTPPPTTPEAGRTPAIADHPLGQDETSSVLVGVVRERETKLPIAGAKVWLEDALDWIPAVRTSQDGTFRLESRVLQNGLVLSYSVDAVAPEYVRRRTLVKLESWKLTRSEDGRSVTLDEGKDELGEITLQPGTLTLPPIELVRGTRILGRVVDPAGRPLTGVRVIVERQEVKVEPAQVELGPMDIEPIPHGWTEKYESDFRGTFTIPSLYPKGKCLLTLALKGYVTLRKTVAVMNPPEEEEFVLVPGLGVQGHVRNMQGHPLGGVRVFALSPASRQFVPAAPTSKDGNFSFVDLSPDTSFLVACLPGHGISRVELSGKDARPVPIVASEAGGKLSGLVVDQDGAPLEGATIVVEGYTFSLGDHKVRIAFQDDPTGISDAARGDGELDPEWAIQAHVPQAWAPPPVTSQGGGRFHIEKLAFGPGFEVELLIRKDGYSSVGVTASEGETPNPQIRKLDR